MAVWSARRSQSRKSASDGQASAPSSLMGAQPQKLTPSVPMKDPVPATADWLVRGKDGRLTAYAPVDGGVLRWTEKNVGGPEWSGPELLPAPGLVPHLSIVQSPEGYVFLTGLRRLPGGGDHVDASIVYAVQYQTGRPLRDWHSLNSPYTSKDNRHLAAELGLPSALVDPEGSMHMFVRNAGRGVSGRSQETTGRWKGWGDIKGSGVSGTVAVTVNDAGLAEVSAPCADRVLRWSQQEPGWRMPRADELTEVSVADGTFTATRTGRETVTRFWRDAGTGEVVAWRPGDRPRPLGGGSGTGPVALLRTPVDGVDCTLLAQRDASGRPALAAYPTETEGAGLEWSQTGEVCAGAPAMALDGLGRVVLAAIGEDGALRVTRQKEESGLAMEAWTRV
ncbi:hypothetical protein ACFXA4_33980 [Streptomyces sp. NPDC059442]|uniref:hypothetical protein n=1 Tax=Streptomyces sp. NPDC059442 TaxID=3346830 RepID=UPI0036CED4F1